MSRNSTGTHSSRTVPIALLTTVPGLQDWLSAHNLDRDTLQKIKGNYDAHIEWLEWCARGGAAADGEATAGATDGNDGSIAAATSAELDPDTPMQTGSGAAGGLSGADGTEASELARQESTVADSGVGALRSGSAELQVRACGLLVCRTDR